MIQRTLKFSRKRVLAAPGSAESASVSPEPPIWHNATMLLRSALSIFVLTLLHGPLWGCSKPAQNEASEPEEYAEACRALELRLAELKQSKLSETVQTAGLALLAEHPGKQWIRLGDQAISRIEFESFQHWNDPVRYAAKDGAIQVAFETILGYDRALDERNVRLVVVVIPARLDADPERMPGVDLPKQFHGSNAGLVQFLLDLNRAGVDAIDLGPGFAEKLHERNEDELYLAYDLHWGPRAVALAADLVGEHLEQKVGLKLGSEKKGRDFILKRERASYLVPPAMPALLPVAEQPIELRFDRVLKRDGTPAFEQDRKSPILVLGDSFTCYYREEACDFSSQLQARMRTKLDTIAMRAGASKTVWKNIRRRKQGVEGKRVVIWLIGSALVASGEITPVDVFSE